MKKSSIIIPSSSDKVVGRLYAVELVNEDLKETTGSQPYEMSTLLQFKKSKMIHPQSLSEKSKVIQKFRCNTLNLPVTTTRKKGTIITEIPKKILQKQLYSTNISKYADISAKKVAVNSTSNSLFSKRTEISPISLKQSTSEFNENACQDNFQKFIAKSLQEILMRLDKIEEKQNENEKLILQLVKRKSVTVRDVPPCFPFKTIKDLFKFEGANDTLYDEVVNYLVYLGGLTVTESTARYIKNAFDLNDDILSITWNGSKKLNKIGLSESRFVRACEEAVGLNSSFTTKPSHDEFVWAMSKALKSSKERLRRSKVEESLKIDTSDEHPARKFRKIDSFEECDENEDSQIDAVEQYIIDNKSNFIHADGAYIIETEEDMYDEE